MIKILKRKSIRKKYDELLSITSKVLVEKQNLKDENEFLKQEIRKLTREREWLRNGLIK